MFKNNVSMKVISLLAALVLWLYVMGEVDPELRGKVADIPVNLINTEELAYRGLAPVYEEQMYISATISGKRSDVNMAKRNGLVATVDVSECDKGENDLKININLPVGVSLENMSQNTVSIEADTYISVYKPVVVEFPPLETAAEKAQLVQEYYPQGVYVSGAKSSLEKVTEVKATIEPEKATEKSEWITVKLKPVNKKGKAILGLTLSQETAEARIQELPFKSVVLSIATEAEEENIGDTPIPELVYIAGDKETLDKISKVDGVVTTDEEGIVSIDTDLPEGVYLVIGEDNGKIIWN